MQQRQQLRPCPHPWALAGPALGWTAMQGRPAAVSGLRAFKAGSSQQLASLTDSAAGQGTKQLSNGLLPALAVLAGGVPRQPSSAADLPPLPPPAAAGSGLWRQPSVPVPASPTKCQGLARQLSLPTVEQVSAAAAPETGPRAKRRRATSSKPTAQTAVAAKSTTAKTKAAPALAEEEEDRKRQVGAGCGGWGHSVRRGEDGRGASILIRRQLQAAVAAQC